MAMTSFLAARSRTCPNVRSHWNLTRSRVVLQTNPLEDLPNHPEQMLESSPLCVCVCISCVEKMQRSSSGMYVLSLSLSTYLAD